MDCIVFYESWQMECCGMAFSTGDTVKWLARQAGEMNAPSVDLGRIDYCYEAHSADWKSLFVLEGKVRTIQILYQRYEPDADNPRLLLPVSGETVEAETAEGFEKRNGMEASGYIVGLTGAFIRPAMQGEVTFQ